jgi:phosphate transport system ATP-binding protein
VRWREAGRAVLLDEPTSALDPISTGRIEQLIEELKQRLTPSSSSPTTCSRRHASPITPPSCTWANWSNIGVTEQLFVKPKVKQTEDYITGRFG